MRRIPSLLTTCRLVTERGQHRADGLVNETERDGRVTERDGRVTERLVTERMAL